VEPVEAPVSLRINLSTWLRVDSRPAPIATQVCQEMSSLLRRELRGASGELRRGATAELAASSAAGQGDYTLMKEKHGSPAG
jgi:hypothetical protein